MAKTYNRNGEVIVRTQDYLTLTYRRPAATSGHYVDRWYDKRSRNWVVQYMQADGYQVGAADVVYSEAEAIACAESLSKEVRS